MRRLRLWRCGVPWMLLNCGCQLGSCACCRVEKSEQQLRCGTVCNASVCILLDGIVARFFYVSAVYFYYIVTHLRCWVRNMGIFFLGVSKFRKENGRETRKAGRWCFSFFSWQKKNQREKETPEKKANNGRKHTRSFLNHQTRVVCGCDVVWCVVTVMTRKQKKTGRFCVAYADPK